MTDPLVIIPGFMQDARSFMPQIVALGRDRAVTILMPGAGETIEDISLAWAPRLPRSFALLGHGLGGVLALDLLRRIPERIARIALIATDPMAEPAAARAGREARLALPFDQAMAQDMPVTALAEAPWRDDILALVQDMALTLGPDVYRQQNRLMQRRPDAQKTLRGIKLPALILTGAQDPLVPAQRATLLAGLMPFGEMQVIPDAGHLPQLEQPEAVTTALRRFLAGPLLLR